MGAVRLSKNSIELSGSLPRSLNLETRSLPNSGNFQPTLAVSLWHLSGNFREGLETGLEAKFASHRHCHDRRLRFELLLLQIQGVLGRNDEAHGPSPELWTVSQWLSLNSSFNHPEKLQAAGGCVTGVENSITGQIAGRSWAVGSLTALHIYKCARGQRPHTYIYAYGPPILGASRPRSRFNG
jgi:hypothetical protein